MSCSLYVGPVSEEIMEAAYRARKNDGYMRDVRLCCSVGQVGPDAYTGITLDKFRDLHSRFRKQYNVYVLSERDHLGRGQDAASWCDWETGPWRQYRTERSTFNAFHFHSSNLCAVHDVMHDYFSGDQSEHQIGVGEESVDLAFTERESQWDGWVSFPMGLEIVGLRNVYKLDPSKIDKMRSKFPRARIRAHACDYLSCRTLRAVKALCDGVNVAPQLGVYQSCLYLEQATRQSVDLKSWRETCCADSKQISRWQLSELEWYGVGHYHLQALPPAFRADVREYVVDQLTKFIGELYDC